MLHAYPSPLLNSLSLNALMFSSSLPYEWLEAYARGLSIKKKKKFALSHPGDEPLNSCFSPSSLAEK